MRIKFKWERLDENTYRAKVWGGWIINTIGYNEVGMSEALTFVLDPHWEWEIEE